jgi:Raf kinase inhibitor-like YbhB/YbcL family protein
MISLLIISLVPVTQCKNSTEPGTVTHFLDDLKTMTVFSNAFNNGDFIPRKYSCYGENVSPPLNWSGIPAGTRSFAVFMIDASAGFIHMLLYNLPSNVTSLTEDVMNNVPTGALFATNNLGITGYYGPCPDNSTNEYHFEVYALDSSQLDLSTVQSTSDLLTLIRDHVLAWGELVGKFSSSNNS